MKLWIDKFETDDELVNECLTDHVTAGTNLFEDALVLKEQIAKLQAENAKLKEQLAEARELGLYWQAEAETLMEKTENG